MKELAEQCHSLSFGISQFLSNWLSSRNDFNCRSFYGESFTLNLLHRHNLLSNEVKTKLMTAYKGKDKSDPEFHHEFNNYAFSDYYLESKDENVRPLYFPLVFKGTTCTNWTLLRNVVRLKENIDIDEALKESSRRLEKFQLASGLILDDPGVKSFQYHCFSASLVLELYKRLGDDGYKKRFLDSVIFIRHFILPNGDALYVGRGQEQSFGMGALVYILAEAYKMTNDQSILSEIKNIIKFINSAKRPDGSFPLVFNNVEKSIPACVDMLNPEFCGWYPYNNYFDYLPFMGFYLHKASLALSGIDMSEGITSNPQTSYSDSSFVKVVCTRYISVLSKPGGYWTNDLSFPLVYYKNELITPMLGGEQFQKSLYDQEMLSFPVTKWKRLAWRKCGRGFWIGNRLFWISCFGLLVRNFVFKEDKIIIKNRIFSWLKSEDLYSFKGSARQIDPNTISDKKFVLKFDKKILSEKEGYSASGKLKVFSVDQNSTITMELL
ncbi:MAG: hypothetical protein ACXVLQ_17885 [Bacteriovorax sp.]